MPPIWDGWASEPQGAPANMQVSSSDAERSLPHGRLGEIRHDWTVADVRALFALPFPDLMFRGATDPSDAFRRARGADFHASVDQDRRLPGGLRLLSAKRALRNRRQGGEADGPRCRAGRSAQRQSRRRQPLLHGRGLALAQGSRSRPGLRHDRGRRRAGARNLRHARHADASAGARASRRPGLDYYNHNLDTSPEYYGRIITTRTYQDRLDTLAHVRDAGIHVCCGGIVGMGEGARGPRRHDRDAGEPAGASGERADQHAGAGRRHAARGAAQSSIRSRSCAPSRWRASPCRPRSSGSRPAART